MLLKCRRHSEHFHKHIGKYMQYAMCTWRNKKSEDFSISDLATITIQTIQTTQLLLLMPLEIMDMSIRKERKKNIATTSDRRRPTQMIITSIITDAKIKQNQMQIPLICSSYFVNFNLENDSLPLVSRFLSLFCANYGDWGHTFETRNIQHPKFENFEMQKFS